MQAPDLPSAIRVIYRHRRFPSRVKPSSRSLSWLRLELHRADMGLYLLLFFIIRAGTMPEKQAWAQWGWFRNLLVSDEGMLDRSQLDFADITTVPLSVPVTGLPLPWKVLSLGQYGDRGGCTLSEVKWTFMVDVFWIVCYLKTYFQVHNWTFRTTDVPRKLPCKS